MTYTVAGTGSRSFQPTDAVTRQVDEHLLEIWRQHRDLQGMSGMAEGFDEFLAERFIANGIPWVAAIPNPGYGAYYWGNNSQTGRPRMAEFKALLDQAVDVVYVCQQYYEDGLHSNFHRNRYLVVNSDEFLVGAPLTKGTAHCFQAIKRAKKPYRVFGVWAQKPRQDRQIPSSQPMLALG